MEVYGRLPVQRQGEAAQTKRETTRESGGTVRAVFGENNREKSREIRGTRFGENTKESQGGWGGNKGVSGRIKGRGTGRRTGRTPGRTPGTLRGVFRENNREDGGSLRLYFG